MQILLTKQEVIEEMTRRLVEFYRPVRIYLFGSEARGEAGPDSDLDFLVVVPDNTPERMVRSSEVYSLLPGIRHVEGRDSMAEKRLRKPGKRVGSSWKMLIQVVSAVGIEPTT